MPFDAVVPNDNAILIGYDAPGIAAPVTMALDGSRREEVNV